MTPAEALRLALSKEKEAIVLYRKLAIQHSVIKDLLLELMNEEEKHARLIEERISKLI